MRQCKPRQHSSSGPPVSIYRKKALVCYLVINYWCPAGLVCTLNVFRHTAVYVTMTSFTCCSAVGINTIYTLRTSQWTIWKGVKEKKMGLVWHRIQIWMYSLKRSISLNLTYIRVRITINCNERLLSTIPSQHNFQMAHWDFKPF